MYAFENSSVRRESGFTLLELLMVVVIVGIITTVGVPAMRTAVLTQRVKGAASDISAALNYARSEAVKRNATVNVVPVDGTWMHGWTIEVASSGTVLHTQNALTNISATGPSTGISYVANGRLAGGAQNFGLSAADDTRAAIRCVHVDTSGHAHVSTNSCS